MSRDESLRLVFSEAEKKETSLREKVAQASCSLTAFPTLLTISYHIICTKKVQHLLGNRKRRKSNFERAYNEVVISMCELQVHLHFQIVYGRIFREVS